MDVISRLRTVLILGLASSAIGVVGAATVGFASSTPSGDLACRGDAMMDGQPDYLPVVNPASAGDTMKEFIDYNMFGDLGSQMSELSIDVSALGSTSSNAAVLNAHDDVVVVAAMELDEDYGWRVVSWLRCG